jgi:uncharacterized protein (DUF2062 family)
MLRKTLRRWLPSEDDLRQRRSLRWLGPLLSRPGLWHLSRRSVAMGAAIGVFFGFLIPVLQIAAAAAFAVALRANLPVAAASTLVSNPLTYAPIFLLAYKTGSSLMGRDIDDAKAAALAAGTLEGEDDWVSRARDIGKPLFVGLAVFAVVGGVVTWGAVNLLWSAAVVLRRRRGIRRAQAPPG